MSIDFFSAHPFVRTAIIELVEKETGKEYEKYKAVKVKQNMNKLKKAVGK